jgi:signal transduction histidine kinase
MVTYAYIDNVSFTKYFIPQTWFAGRIVLSAMLVLAIAKYPAFSKEEKIKNQKLLQEGGEFRSETDSEENVPTIGKQTKGKGEGDHHESKTHFRGLTSVTESPYKTFIVYFTFLSALAGIVAISSLFVVYPYSVIDHFFVHRPYEIPCLILFIIALILFYKNGLYKKTDVFFKGILAYLIIDIYAQIIMSFSANSFDTAHMVAHVLKDAGYIINIIALVVSSIQYNVRLRESNLSLIDSNIRLKEREEVIRTQLEELRESEKMKDEFINTAAHELRTPIQPIIGLTNIISSKIAELIGRGSGDYIHQGEIDINHKLSEEQQKQQQLLDLLAVITRNAKRLRQLSENILDATKIESHTLKLNKEQFDIRELISETLKEQNDSVKARGTRVEIVCAAGEVSPADSDSSAHSEPESKGSTETCVDRNAAVGESYLVKADRTKISQVLNNLLSNSLKAIKSKADNSNIIYEGGGRIAIQVKKINGKGDDERMGSARDDRSTSGEIIVSMTDNGIGLSPEIVPKLFSKFASGSDSGTGLGLYISKNIIEAHGGRIWAGNNLPVDVKAPASFGATISFSLPTEDI